MKLRALKGRAQITAAFRRGKRFTQGDASVSIRTRRFAHEEDAPKGGEFDVFLVCAVRKKIAPHAVVRNRIKRLVRESVRSFVKEHQSNSKTLPFMTLAFNWQKAPSKPSEISLHEVKPEVYDALHQAMQYFSNREQSSKNS